MGDSNTSELNNKNMDERSKCRCYGKVFTQIIQPHAKNRMATSIIKNIGSVTEIGSVTAGDSTVAINLSQNAKNFKFLCVCAEADGNLDFKIAPTNLLTVFQNIAGKGVHLKVLANNNYYWEGNVGVYASGTKAEIATKNWSGWKAAIKIYGIN